mgnify:CR=1 FL=1
MRLHLEAAMSEVLEEMDAWSPTVAVTERIDPNRLHSPPVYGGNYEVLVTIGASAAAHFALQRRNTLASILHHMTSGEGTARRYIVSLGAGGSFSASPLAAGERLYFVAEGGETIVLADAAEQSHRHQQNEFPRRRHSPCRRRCPRAGSRRI